ncbi:MAG: histidine kinase dimerization/phospho-acceptor domain-containing protein, partial [Verrucomicrobiales bacterium]
MRLTRVTLFLIALIISLGFYRLIDYLLEGTETQTLQATEEMMVDTAQLLAHQLSARPESLNPEELSSLFAAVRADPARAHIYELEKDSFGLNVLVTDATGRVLADTGHPERVGTDLSEARDIHLCLQGKYGARSTRTDEEDDTSSVMYVAAPLRHEGEITGALSLYKGQRDVLPFISMRRREIIAATLLIGTGILALITAVFIWLFRPVGKLTTYARALSRGERRELPDLGAGLEVNTLGHALRDMKQALDGRRYIENYVQTLTHELKSPLAAIQGAAELLEEDLPEPERRRFLRNIRTETARSEELIRRLLELASVESCDQLENRATFDLRELVADALAEFSSAAQNAQLKLHSDLPTQPCEVNGNRELLRSALRHLIT